MLSEEQTEDIENWDPVVARNEMDKKRLKMPVVFIREDLELPLMSMTPKEPVAKKIESTMPQTVFKKRNKNTLF